MYKNKIEEKREKKSLWISEIRSYILCIVITEALVFILFRVIFCIVSTPTESMMPTFCPKDIAICYRRAYRNSEPQRGDIISFKHYHDGENEKYMKRVIGIAGDEISFVDGYVYINGEKWDESAYIGEDVETNCTKTFVVPQGYVFVLGDNRENSRDSRYWDNPYVSVEDILDKEVFILPFHKLYHEVS